MRYLMPITWLWIIIIGGLMITPGGVECIVCGPTLTRLIGVASIILAITAFIANQRAIQR